jgi:single-strand DNA-binding protein
MPAYNRVILVGNLTRDPETKGTSLVILALAINRNWVGQDGQKHEDTTFVDVKAFGKTGELAVKYLAKGMPALIEGRLALDRWTATDGKQHSRLEVVAERLQFLGGGPGRGQAAAAPAPRTETPPASEDIDPETIPF